MDEETDRNNVEVRPTEYDIPQRRWDTERICAACGMADPLSLSLLHCNVPKHAPGVPVAGTDGRYVVGLCGHRMPAAWYGSGFSTCSHCAWSDLDIWKPGQA